MSISKSFLLLFALVVGGCSQEDSTPTHPIVAGTSNKFFTARSEREIQPTEGTTVLPVPGQDGKPLGYLLIARNNGGVTGITCSGSCSNSEQNPCGGCSAQQASDTISCSCEISACAGSCKADQTIFGTNWSRAQALAPAASENQSQ